MAMSALTSELSKAVIVAAIVSLYWLLPPDHFLAPGQALVITLVVTEFISLVAFAAVSPCFKSLDQSKAGLKKRASALPWEATSSPVGVWRSRAVRWTCYAAACCLPAVKVLRPLGPVAGCFAAVVLGSLLRAWLEGDATSTDMAACADDPKEEEDISPDSEEFWAELGPVRNFAEMEDETCCTCNLSDVEAF